MDLAEKIELFSQTEYALEEQIVFAIRGDGKFFPILSKGQYATEIANGHTIKVQSLEKFNADLYRTAQELQRQFNHDGPVTCHAFIAQAGSPSFGWHVDLDDVFLKSIRGTKVMEYKEAPGNIRRVELDGKETLFLPAGTWHRAVNEQPSIMLSFGLERFMIDKATE